MKKLITKSLSVFLSLLMVFSMFVFTPEMFTKAEASFSSGKYYVKLTVDISDGADADTWQWSIYGKSANGTAGTEDTTILNQQSCKCKDNNTTYTITGGDKGSSTGIIETNAFPTRVYFYYMNKAALSVSRTGSGTINLYVGSKADGSDLKKVAFGSITEHSYDLMTTHSANATGYFKFQNKNAAAWYEKYWKVSFNVSTSEYPSATGITWVETAQTVDVPASTTANSYTSANAIASVVDQYGVNWGATQPNFIVATTEDGTNTVSGITATLDGSNKAAISVANGARAYCAGDASNLAYVRARVATKPNSSTYIYADEKLTLTVNNYKVDVNYKLNDGSSVGSYFGTEEDQKSEDDLKESVYWGAKAENLPISAYRHGYTFDGIFTAASNGTQVTAPLKIEPSAAATTSVNYYAHWTAVDNTIAYYNSDGQLIGQYTGKFDTKISNAKGEGNAAQPTSAEYPGKTQLPSGSSYTFAGWIVWDWPGHPEKAGTDLNGNDLFDLDEGEVVKAIATYTLNGSVMSYTATFKYANGTENVKTASGAYWTPVEMPNATDNTRLEQTTGAGATVTEGNGFEIASYDYKFEGWTLTTPANGKWTEVEAGEAEFAITDTYRLKSNVTFYPCYSKEIKKCAVTKKVYTYNAATSTLSTITTGPIKDIDTELGKTYDLGAPEQFSFNMNGYTYTFKGWKETNTLSVGTGTPDVVYANGKAEITLTKDVTYFAVYEKTEIKYNAYYYNGTKLIASYEDLARYESDMATLVSYNTGSQFDGETPERERDDQTGYTFVGWVEDQTKVLDPENADLVTAYTFGEQSKTFYAAYSTFSYYTVTFKNDSGNVIQTSKDYVTSDTIAYTATAPDTEAEDYDAKLFIPIVKNKASGAQYQYTFMGWQSNDEADNTLNFEDDALGTVSYAVALGTSITVTADKVYTAVFKKEIREYTIYLYGVGTNPNYTTNEDGYVLYTYTDEETDITTNYFVKEKQIYIAAPGTETGYALYTGELTVADLTPVKPEAKKTLTLRYGDNILDAVKALYTYDGNGTADKNVTAIDGHKIEIVPYGSDEKVKLPYETKQYSYAFNGWNPSINPNATVTGDASYVATYRTDNVLYNVHWFTPTACSSTAPYAGTAFSESVTYYRYRRAIAVPAKTPTVSAPTSISNYTWTFLGWYACDENQVIKTDSEGKEIKFVKGTLADPDTNGGSRDYYYVAKFGFVANNYTVKVYDEDGTTLLGTYKGAYNTPVNITNYEKAPDDEYHYTLTGFAKLSGEEGWLYPAEKETDTTPYTVSGNIDLKVVYQEAEHGWTKADRATVVHTTPATYAADGLDTITCICGHKKTEVVPKLIDVNGPTGKVAIKAYNWDKDGGPTEAYIRTDALVAIMAVDYGANDIAENPIYNAGNGIKSIVYTWLDGEDEIDSGSMTYDKYTKTSANLDIQVPTNFVEGMTLKAVITDWEDDENAEPRTYTIVTGKLYTDTEKPVIYSENPCDGFTFSVTEKHLDSIVLTYDGTEIDLTGHEYELQVEARNTVAYSLGATEESILPNGEYVLTATDKAGNTATKTFTITNNHEWNNGKITTVGTCTVDEVKTFTCTACGAERTTEKTAPGHKWNAKYKTEETEVDGETVEIEVLDKYIYTVDVEPTCTEKGSKSIHCTVCGEKMQDSDAEIEENGHKYKTNEKAASCASAGYKITTCEKCDFYKYEGYEQLTHEVKLDADGADAEGWIVGKDSTCTAKGYKYQICSLCGEKINKTDIPMKSHNFENRTPGGSYCTRAPFEGATPDTYRLYKCTVCGYSYEFNTNAKLHDYKKTVMTEATCTGNEIDTYTCNDCGDFYFEEVRLTALGHKWNDDYTVDVEADCITEGSKSIHCSRDTCTEKKDVTVIPALGHDYVSEVTTPATAHTPGVMTYTCSRCDDSYTEDIAPTGHTYDEGFVMKSASCTSEGVMTYTCTDSGCDETMEGHTYTVAIPMTPHEASTTIVSHSDATCIAYEKTVYKCKNCEDGTVTVYGTDYAPHKAGDLVKTVNAATCTTAGSGIYNCSVCGQTMTAEIPATGEHNYIDTVEVAATCLDNGVMKHTCKLCGYYYTDEITAPGSHDWNTEYTVDTEPTCTTTGWKSIHCSRCGEVKADTQTTVDKLGHDKIIDAKVEPTCSKTGLTEGWHCSRCDAKLAQEEIAKKPHTQGDLLMVNKAPTCVAKGESVYKCSVCGESYTTETPIDPTAHNWGAWGAWVGTKEATCTEAGEETRERTCQNTGCTAEADKETREIAALGHDMIVDTSKDPNPEITTENGVTTTVTYYICSREGCGETEERTTTTTVYTVTVQDTDGNAYGSPITIAEGEKLTADKIGTLPTKETGADEDGAYIIKWLVGGTEVTLPLDVTSNITLTYDFTFVANKYTVTFYNYGGKVISSKEYVKGDTVEVPEAQYVSGYRFKGWTDGTNDYAPNEIPTVTATVSYRPWVVSNDNYKTYYVTFKNENGTATLRTIPVECEAGQSVSFKLPDNFEDPTKAPNTVYHYVFAGWIDANGNPVTFPTNISESVTYTAKFNAEKHDYENGVITQQASCVKPEITTYTCPTCSKVKEAYTKEATGHDYQELSREVEGNTTTIHYECTVCKETYDRTVISGSQTDVIVVKVNDGSAPVAGATVTVYVGQLQTLVAVTDEDGCAYFNKDDLPDGSYQTKVTKDNYDSAAGTMVVSNGTAILKLTLTKQVCHCVCHANTFFGKVRRLFNKFFRLFNKNYTCCSCGECERIY